MRPRHTLHSLPSFPVYSCTFLTPHRLVLGGGGGASRSGIKNKLRIYDIAENHHIQLLDEYELEKGEDAPMSMASHTENETLVCGVNSVIEKLEKGENENCRIFSVKDAKIKPLNTRNTLSTADMDDYQKVTVLSPDGTLVAVAGAHDLSILSYPAMELVAMPIHTEKEIYDISFSNISLVVTTTHNLLVYALPTVPLSTAVAPASHKKKKKRKASVVDPSEKMSPLSLQKSVELPSSVGEGSTFRAARYHPQDQRILFSVINSVPPRTRKTRTVIRQAYICKWNTETWVVEKTKKVGDRGLTCFDVSIDGCFLGYGSSDLTIGVLDAKNLSPLFTILKTHDFPPTTLKFNSTTTLLVSGSADNTIRVVSVQHAAGGLTWGFILFLLLAILVAALALFAKQYIGAGDLTW
ncbi:WD40 repeat-like protein [Phlegmacium glaucopus]|nr:WD40 repeat-like protein [Phlegmacium glaucopus]